MNSGSYLVGSACMALLVVIVAISAAGLMPTNVIFVSPAPQVDPIEEERVVEDSVERIRASVKDIVLAGSCSGFRLVGVDRETTTYIFERLGSDSSAPLEFELSTDLTSAMPDATIRVIGWGDTNPIVVINGDHSGYHWFLESDQDFGTLDLVIEVEHDLEPGSRIFVGYTQ